MVPSVFIGSSRERIAVADAIQVNLEHDAECTVWDQDVFRPSKYAIECLFDIVTRVDFGIFVFTPDDITYMREDQYDTVRDNVLFEIGLFIGHMGRERSVIVKPSGNNSIRIPTDLLGLIAVEYNPSRRDGNLISALAPACCTIRDTLSRLGSRFPDETYTEGIVKFTPPARVVSTVVSDETYSFMIDPSYKSFIETYPEQFLNPITFSPFSLLEGSEIHAAFESGIRDCVSGVSVWKIQQNASLLKYSSQRHHDAYIRGIDHVRREFERSIRDECRETKHEDSVSARDMLFGTIIDVRWEAGKVLVAIDGAEEHVAFLMPVKRKMSLSLEPCRTWCISFRDSGEEKRKYSTDGGRTWGDNIG